MRIGSQRNLITIQRKVQIGVDRLSAPIFKWQDWRPDVFCEAIAKRGKEQFDPSSKQRFSEEVWHFRTRYDEVNGANNTMRVLHEGQLFDIKAILPDAQRHWDCVLECTLQNGQMKPAPLGGAITTEIPSGVVGEVYPGFTVTAQGGLAPYLFDLASGAVPGLTLAAATGVWSGTPTTAGSFDVEIRITDADGAIDVMPAFAIEIEAA